MASQSGSPERSPKRVALTTSAIRYIIVGVATNLTGYLVYLALTAAGLDPKIALTLLYWVVVSLSYFGNSRWSFGHGRTLGNAVRFLLTHLSAYLINLGLLYLFVDRLGYPHQFVQIGAVAIVTAYLFVMMRLVVFPQRQTAGLPE